MYQFNYDEMMEVDGHLEQEFLTMEVVEIICDYLTLNDMRALRQTNTLCNYVINQHSQFADKCQGVLSTKWHSLARGYNLQNTICWKTVILKRFTFYRNSENFKMYWIHVGKNLTQLTIQNTSLECDGFSNILNHLPKLKTLILSESKFRDVDDIHTNTMTQPSECTGKFEQPIRHLIIEKTARLEGCFFEYLKKRTGQLESLTVKNCFEYEQLMVQMDIKKVKKQIYEFQYYILELLIVNGQTLKKFICENNAVVTPRIFKVCKNFNFQQLNELHISFLTEPRMKWNVNKESEDMNDIIEFIKVKRNILQKIGFIFFMNDISNENLIKLLEPIKTNLVSLKITFYVEKEKGCRPNDIDLSIINEMIKLEKLEILDKKDIDLKNIKKIMKSNTHTEVKEEFLNKIKSPIKLEGIFPISSSKIKELTLSKIILPLVPKFLNSSSSKSGSLTVSFQNLTRLEIQGPWHYDITPLIRKIVKEAKELQTLILPNCFISDTNLTGLDEHAVNRLHGCLAHMMKARKNILAVNSPLTPDGFQPLFSLLSELKHLDLSGNEGISDVSLAQSLNIPELLTLNLSGCNISDNGLELVARNMPKLKVLNVRTCFRISKVGLNQVIKACPKLHRIYASKRIRNLDIGFFNDPRHVNFLDIVVFSQPENKGGGIMEDIETEDNDVDT